jgi:hypothetical protein
VGRVTARDDLKATVEQMQNEIEHLAVALNDKSSRTRTEESVKETQESAKKTDEALRGLADSQTRTEESVKKTGEALRQPIAVVDRYISKRRNGDSGASTTPGQ